MAKADTKSTKPTKAAKAAKTAKAAKGDEGSEEATHGSIEEHSKLFRDLLLGFVKVHVLHHASHEPVYGVGITAELDRHGYRLSPGTLYPLLHSLEVAKFLERENQIVGGKVRKYYQITPLGQRALAEARLKIAELVDEIFEDEPSVVRRLRSAGVGKKRSRAKGSS